MPVRLLTAAAYATVLLAAVLFGGTLGLALLVAVLGVLACRELLTIVRGTARASADAVALFGVAAMPLASAAWGSAGLLGVASAATLALLLAHTTTPSASARETAVTLLGVTYIGVLLSHLVLVRTLDTGLALVLVAIVSVWASDVFAYLVGSTLGRHKMAPRISPNKSWEGFIAGTVGTVAVWTIGARVIELGITTPLAAATGIAVALAAVAGDLFESRLKREAGVKDSGTALPGHGGFLDRIDSLILVSAVVYYVMLAGGVR